MEATGQEKVFLCFVKKCKLLALRRRIRKIKTGLIFVNDVDSGVYDK